jgi:hypothetical protein
VGACGSEPVALDRYFVTNERDLAEAVSKVAALRATTSVKPTLVPRQAEA